MRCILSMPNQNCLVNCCCSWLPSLPPPTFFNTNYGMQCTTMNHETLGIPEKPKKPKAYLSNLLKNRRFS